MSKKLHTESIYGTTPSLSDYDKAMLREAIRGEFEGGKYLRDMGTGAAAGAATGAIAGAGVGSLPGAAVGAISGAAFGAGSNAVSDIAYQMYGNEGKAAWQAGDIQEKLEKMGGLIAGKIQFPEIGQLMNTLGTQYKNYIDVSVNKVDKEDQKKLYQQNIFNPASDAHQAFNNALQPHPQAQARTRKLTRVAADQSPSGIVGGLGAAGVADKTMQSMGKPNTAVIPTTVAPAPVVPISVAELRRKYLLGTLNEVEKQQLLQYSQIQPEAFEDVFKWKQDPLRYQEKFNDAMQAEKALGRPTAPALPNATQQIVPAAADDIAGQASKAAFNPKNLLNATWKGIKGFGVGIAVDFTANWLLDKIDMAMTGGEINMFRKDLGDIGKTITEVNRLTSNQKDVVYAGNILWTNLQQVDRMLNEASAKKSQQESPQVAQQNTQQTVPTGLPTATASLNDIKFKRV
jgi:hypothetical protein